MSKYFVAIYSICTCKIRLKMNSDSILHEERKKKKRSSYEIALHRSGHFVKKKSMSSSCRMSRGTCSNINKATPLSVIIFHRWQKEPNSNRFEGLCIIPLHISIHFSTLKSGKNRLEGWWASVRWWPRPGRIFFDIPSSRVEERNRIRVASCMRDFNFYIKRFDFLLDIPRNEWNTKLQRNIHNF